MDKRLIVVSFSISLLFAYNSYGQTYSKNNGSKEEDQIESISKDSTMVPKELNAIQTIHLKGKISNRSRYKDLAKEKERRKRIRAQYQKEKLSKK